jgi:hypothetical protein
METNWKEVLISLGYQLSDNGTTWIKISKT